jgi:hypothetical protein
MDVTEPTVVGSSVIDPLLDLTALNLLFSRTTSLELSTTEMPDQGQGIESDLDLINYPEQGSASTLVSCKSSCRKMLVVGDSRDMLIDPGNPCRTFVSGDELPGGSKLRGFQLPARCSADCGGQLHAVQLRLSATDLQQWARAGKMMRKILSTSDPAQIEQELKYRCDSFMTKYPEFLECLPETARQTRSLWDIETSGDDTIAWRRYLPEGEMLLSTDSPWGVRIRSIEASYLKFYAATDGNGNGKAEAVEWEAMGKEFISSRAENFHGEAVGVMMEVLLPILDLPDEERWPALIFGLSSAYGAIHMAAWNYDFPSMLEGWIWRFSCIALVSFPLPLVLNRCFVTCSWLIDRGRLAKYGVRFLAITTLSTNLLMCCAFARILIVVESFISLRSVPIGVYATVPWAKYIPHL